MINILVVENAKLLSNIIIAGLEEFDYNCIQAFSFKDIKEQISKLKFDYIILNLYLPDAQEMELVASVQRLTDAKIIVLTSKADENLRDLLFKYGVVDYLLKENINQTIQSVSKLIENLEKNIKSNILIIDDSKVMRSQLKNILKSRNYNIFESATGKDGLDIVAKEKLDLLVLDMELGDMHGLDVLHYIKSNPKNKFPIIILSATLNSHMTSKILKGGASDFVKKPLVIEEFLLRTDVLVDYYRQSKELDDYKNHLEDKIEEGISEIKALNKEIEDTQKEVVFTMGAIGESRSKETGNHVKRVAQYSYLLALHYGLSQKEAELLRLASPMHDIGKVAIPDAVLNKPGRFNDEEREIMNNHPKLGFDMLCHSNREVMKAAAIVAYEHHERYDGTGYPRGLKGEQIHIFGRITAIADVFDALGSPRVYKEAWDDKSIWKLLKEGRNKQFDGKLVNIFFDNLDDFLKVREEYADKFD